MKAIVYTSNTGHTAQYAKMLGEKTGLPVYTLKEAGKKLPKGAQIVYLGWLFANSIKDYQKAAKNYQVAALCAVGLCETGTAVEDVRKANGLGEQMPLFTMQGGMDKTKLRGIHKMMIGMLTKGLSQQAERSESDERMLQMLSRDASYVCPENLTAFLTWYENRQ